MSRLFVACFVGLLSVTLLVAAEPPSPFRNFHEVKVERFPAKEKEAAEKLSALRSEGWKYVGPLSAELIAFERPRPQKKLADELLGLMEGTWLRTNSESNGEVDAADEKPVRYIFNGEKCKIQVGADVVTQARVEIVHVGKDFAQFDLIYTDGDYTGTKLTGIVHIEGKQLRWCYSDQSQRPKEFSSKVTEGGGNLSNVILKRE